MASTVHTIVQTFLFLILLFIGVIANTDSDDDTTLDYSWEPASGAVYHYNVYASIDGGAFEMVGVTFTPSYTLTDAKDGATYRSKFKR